MSLSFVNGLWLVGALCFAWMMYRFNRSQRNRYNVVDILMGPNDRASLTNHILLAMAGMSIWVIVDRSNDGKDVDTLLLGVLGIFVIGTTAATVTDIINRAPPSEDPPVKTPPKPKGKAT
jgi:hypothetical protein